MMQPGEKGENGKGGETGKGGNRRIGERGRLGIFRFPFFPLSRFPFFRRYLPIEDRFDVLKVVSGSPS